MIETHPSLTLKVNVENNTPYYSMWTVEQLLKDIQEHTIDKQVLINAIKSKLSTKEQASMVARQGGATRSLAIGYTDLVLYELLEELV